MCPHGRIHPAVQFQLSDACLFLLMLGILPSERPTTVAKSDKWVVALTAVGVNNVWLGRFLGRSLRTVPPRAPLVAGAIQRFFCNNYFFLCRHIFLALLLKDVVILRQDAGKVKSCAALSMTGLHI